MPQGVPLDQVKAMKAQGYENNQIIESLQRDGYSSAQIFDAINQADLVPGSDLGGFPPKGAPAQAAFPAPRAEEYQEHAHETPSSYELANTEELVEAIIDEKWNDLIKDINKIIDWKNETETKVVALEQKFDMLKDQFDKLHQAIIGKIGEYDKHILDVGAEVKAMEKVFSKVLPIFTENVHELQNITEKLKGPK
ncbi:MAG: hypothetical protein ABIJ21_02360 [Nanoarchaeota archaeon]